MEKGWNSAQFRLFDQLQPFESSLTIQSKVKVHKFSGSDKHGGILGRLQTFFVQAVAQLMVDQMFSFSHT